MAVRFFLASDIVPNFGKNIYKPSQTLGRHAVEFETVSDGKTICVRGINTKKEFKPIHLEEAISIEELAKLPVENGKIGVYEFSEISPWQQVKLTDVLRYDCGEIVVCKGQFAALKRAELLGDPGAHEAMKSYLFERWLSKEAKANNLTTEEVKVLFKDANLSYGWKPKIERVSTPHNEWDGPAEDPNYRGYRLMLETSGSQCYEQPVTLLPGHRVWKQTHWNIDPYNRAYGYTSVGVTYYVL